MALSTPSAADLQELSWLRLREARALYDAGLYDGAWYLAGYAVECALKAVVCKTLGMPAYPDKILKGNLKTHVIPELVILSGLDPEFRLKQATTAFAANWEVVESWDPQQRYEVAKLEAKCRSNIVGPYRTAGWSVRMALKSVVVDAFFEAVIAALEEIEQRHGPLSFALLSRSILGTNTWNLTVAGDWLDEESRLRASVEIRATLATKTTSLHDRLGSVLIRNTKEALVRSFLSTLDIPQLGTAYQVTGLEVDYFNLDEAVCLLARLTHAKALSA